MTSAGFTMCCTCQKFENSWYAMEVQMPGSEYRAKVPASCTSFPTNPSARSTSAVYHHDTATGTQTSVDTPSAACHSVSSMCIIVYHLSFSTLCTNTHTHTYTHSAGWYLQIEPHATVLLRSIRLRRR
jgi:hypothetical protein